MCLIQVKTPEKRPGLKPRPDLKPQLQHFIDLPRKVSASFQHKKRISPLNNLSACLFWLCISAEAWIWSEPVLAWTFSSVLIRKGWKASSRPFWGFLNGKEFVLEHCLLLTDVTCTDSVDIWNCILFFSWHRRFVTVCQQQILFLLIFLTILFHLITISFASQFNYSDFPLIHFLCSQCWRTITRRICM